MIGDLMRAFVEAVIARQITREPGWPPGRRISWLRVWPHGAVHILWSEP